MYDDNVLLKLKRQYSKDEVLGGFVKRIKDLELELGVTRSELDEQIDTNKNLKEEISKLKRLKNHELIDEQVKNRINNLKEQVKHYQNALSKQKKENEELLLKLIKLNNETVKNN